MRDELEPAEREGRHLRGAQLVQLARDDLDELETKHVERLTRRRHRNHDVCLHVDVEAGVAVADGLNDLEEQAEEGALVPRWAAPPLVREHVICDDRHRPIEEAQARLVVRARPGRIVLDRVHNQRGERIDCAVVGRRRALRRGGGQALQGLVNGELNQCGHHLAPRAIRRSQQAALLHPSEKRRQGLGRLLRRHRRDTREHAFLAQNVPAPKVVSGVFLHLRSDLLRRAAGLPGRSGAARLAGLRRESFFALRRHQLLREHDELPPLLLRQAVHAVQRVLRGAGARFGRRRKTHDATDRLGKFRRRERAAVHCDVVQKKAREL